MDPEILVTHKANVVESVPAAAYLKEEAPVEARTTLPQLFRNYSASHKEGSECSSAGYCVD